MSADRCILPPPNEGHPRPTRVPTAKPPPDVSAATALLAAVGARQRWRHGDFVYWLRVMEDRAAELGADAVERIAREAYGIEAVQSAATISARWAHACDPPPWERVRVGAVLMPKVMSVQVDTTAIACALAVEPHPSLWLALCHRDPRPIFFLFDVVRRAIELRRPKMLSTLRRAARQSATLQGWYELLEGQ